MTNSYQTLAIDESRNPPMTARLAASRLEFLLKSNRHSADISDQIIGAAIRFSLTLPKGSPTRRDIQSLVCAWDYADASGYESSLHEYLIEAGFAAFNA